MRITIELDELASEMVARTIIIANPGRNISDVVNAAVTFALCDPEGDDYELSFADKSLRRAQEAREAAGRGALRSVTLDAKATAWIDRYLLTNHRALADADIVSGCVDYALKLAFEAYGEKFNHDLSQGGMFADDGWGYVEVSIYDAKQRRLGRPEWERGKE